MNKNTTPTAHTKQRHTYIVANKYNDTYTHKFAAFTCITEKIEKKETLNTMQSVVVE